MLALLHHAFPLVHWLFHHPQGLLLGEGLFSSPAQQSQQVAQQTEAASAASTAQAEQYTNQAGTNIQNAIAAASPNSYFSAPGLLNPSSYVVNPNDTQTFGVTAPKGTSQGNPFSYGNPLTGTPPTGVPPLSPGTSPFRQTQPVYQVAPPGST